MGRLNKRLVGILAVVLVLGLGLPATWVLVRGARKPDVGPMLARAAEAASAGDIDEAAIRYKRVLQINSKCDAAHVALGELEEKRERLRPALEHYRVAAQLNARNRKALHCLGALCERLELFELLGATADRLLALERDSARAHYWKALALGAAKDHDRAIEEAKRAAQLDPTQANAFIVLAELYRAKERYALSERAYRNGLQVHPQHVKLLVGLGQLFELRKDKAQSLERAREAYEQALAVAPDAPEPRLQLASLFARQEKLKEAEEQLTIAVERNPKDRNALFAYGRFLVSTGKSEKAREHLEGALQRIEEWHECRAFLVDILIDLDDVEAAKEHFDKLPPAAGQTYVGKYLEGRLVHAQGRLGEAVARLREAVELAPGFAKAHFYLGVAYADLGEMGSAQASFEEVARLEPRNRAAQGGLASASLALSRFDTAIQAASSALSAAPDDMRMRRILAQALARKGDVTAAVEQFETIRRQAEDPISPTLALAELRMSRRRFQDAERLIQSLPPEARSSTQARLALARVYRATDQLDRAEKELLEACKSTPEAIAPHRLLAAIHHQRGQVDRARAVLEQFAKAQARSVPAQLTLASFYRSVGRQPDALRVCQQAEQHAQDVPARMAVAVFYRRAGKLPDALRVCRQAEQIDSANVAVADELIRILLALEKPEEALATARKIADARPELLDARLAVPRVLLAQQKWAEAASMLDELAKKHPQEALPLYLLGMARFRQEDLSGAIGAWREVVRLRPDWVAAHALLAEAHFRDRNYAEAISEAERVTQRSPGWRAVRLIAALSRAEKQDYARAIRDYLAARPGQPTPTYYFGLADLYRRGGQHEMAEPALVRAHELAPDSHMVLFALVRHYIEVGKPAEAEELITRLRAGRPADPYPLLLLGDYCRALGRADEAETAFRQAIKLDKESPHLYILLGDLLMAAGRPGEACDAYRQALEGGSSAARAKLAGALTRAGRLAEANQHIEVGIKAGPEDALLHVESARVLLAEAAHGVPGKKLEQCRAACEKAIKLAPSSVDAYLVLAESYLVERPPQNLAAVTALQQAVRASRDISAANLRLARLHLALRNLDEAESQCRRILAISPNHTRALQTLADVLRRKRPEQSPLAQARALANVFPNNPARHMVIATALAAERKWEEAASELRTFLRTKPDAVGALARLVLVLVAAGDPPAAIEECRAFLKRNPKNTRAFELLGTAYLASKQPAKAADAYHAAARLDPTQLRFVAAAANSYAAAKQPDKARACCEPYIAAWPLDARGRVVLGSTLLAQKKPAEAEKQFAKALELDPGSLDALGRLAATCIGQKHFDRAIAACRTHLRVYPSARGWHTLAGVYTARGSLADAQMCLARACGLDRKYVPALFDLGNLHMLSKQYGRAIEKFEKIVSDHPNHVMALNNLAWCLAESGNDLDRAKKVVAKARELDPNAPATLDTFGWICCKREEYETAAAALTRSLELRPDSPTTRYHLAVALAARDKLAEARQEIERALAAKAPFPEEAEARALLAELAK